MTVNEEEVPVKSKKFVTYDAQRIIGQGSFGAVFYTRVVETDEIVAIKKFLQDNRYKSRELQIMRQLKKRPHPYIVKLQHYFSSKGNNAEQVYLNLVLEYVPETLFSVSRYYTKRNEAMPQLFIKIYTYQMFRALAHIHGMGIVHRDIKPHNLLVDPLTLTLKLCDFGSAKVLLPGEPSIAYICSRYYRAPELIMGGDGYIPYTSAIDVWSAGCVLGELLTGTPIFPGMSNNDQLIEIVKVLGTPSDEDLKKMNIAKHPLNIPKFSPSSLESIYKTATPQLIDLIRNTFTYIPERRISAIGAVASVAFDELRDSSTVLPDGSPLSELMWQFTNEELTMASPEVVSNLQRRSKSPSDNPLVDLVAAVTIIPTEHNTVEKPSIDELNTSISTSINYRPTLIETPSIT